jgi:L-asparagine transporter-like permease
MRDSNFWFYFIMVIVIGHFIAGFIYLIIKLSPKKKDKNEKDEQK